MKKKILPLFVLFWVLGHIQFMAQLPKGQFSPQDINKLKIESAELEDVYYKKMCKAVPARKVHEAMQAEDRFHRRMLRKFSNRPDRSKQK